MWGLYCPQKAKCRDVLCTTVHIYIEGTDFAFFHSYSAAPILSLFLIVSCYKLSRFVNVKVHFRIRFTTGVLKWYVKLILTPIETKNRDQLPNPEKQLENHQGGKERRKHQILVQTCNTWTRTVIRESVASLLPKNHIKVHTLGESVVSYKSKLQSARILPNNLHHASSLCTQNINPPCLVYTN